MTVGGVGVGQKIWWPEVATAGLGTSARGSSKQTGGALPTYNFPPRAPVPPQAATPILWRRVPCSFMFLRRPMRRIRARRAQLLSPCPPISARPLRLPPGHTPAQSAEVLVQAPSWLLLAAARCEKATASPPFTKTAKHLRRHQPANRQHAIPTRNPHTHHYDPPETLCLWPLLPPTQVLECTDCPFCIATHNKTTSGSALQRCDASLSTNPAMALFFARDVAA